LSLPGISAEPPLLFEMLLLLLPPGISYALWTDESPIGSSRKRPGTPLRLLPPLSLLLLAV
jgi:hypothetical protein